MYVSGYRVQTAVVVVALIGLIVAGAYAVVTLRRGGQRWQTIARAGLIWIVIAIAGVSLEPDSGRDGAGSCSFVLDSYRFAIDQRALNTVLYVPLGLFAVLAARTTRQRIAAVAAAATLPIVFEFLQKTDFVGRSCDIVDVIDNWVGIAVGAALAAAVLLVRGRIAGRVTTD